MLISSRQEATPILQSHFNTHLQSLYLSPTPSPIPDTQGPDQFPEHAPGLGSGGLA